MTIAQNPILKGFYPDPSICRVGEDYYLVNSTFSYVPGVPVFHSRDLANWEQIGNVLERKSQLVLDGATMSRGIYAPTIRYHKGIFYMITTNVSYGGNFYVTAEDPAGPWSDPVYLKVPEGVDAGIDPSLYFEGDKCYYVGQRQKQNARFFGDCEVWMQELDLERGCLTGPDYILYRGAMKDACWVEGPHLYKIGEYYYVTCAEMGTSFEHSISVARSRELTGPYENYRCNPLLTHRHLGRQYPIQNIGHGDLVDTPDGEWYLVMLGTRPVNNAAELGRETFLARVEWQEGWPVVNPGEGKILERQPVSLPEKSLMPDACPAWQSRMEMRFTAPLDKRFLFFRHPKEDTYQIIKEKEIALKCNASRPEDVDGVLSYMGVRQQSRSFQTEAEVFTGLKEGEQAGLLYLYDDDNYLKFTVLRRKEGVAAIVEKRENKRNRILSESIIGETGLPESESGSWLRLSIKGRGQRTEFSVQGKVIVSGVPTEFLSSERAGGFVGCTYGIYAFGDGTGYARFRNLVIEYPGL